MTDNQRLVMTNWLARDGDLKEAVQEFLNYKAEYCEKETADHMRTIPRSVELAADYASKAEVYREFWKELERWAASN